MDASAQPGDVSENAAAAARSPRTGSARFQMSGQFNRYARSLGWVIRDALPRWPWQVAMIVLCNLLGLAATLGAVGGVMAYARAAEHGAPLQLMGRQWQLTGDVASLLQFGGVIALLGAISAVSVFLADRMILKLAQQYHTLCADRALTIAADPLNRGWQVMREESPRTILARMTGSASRAMAFTLRDVLRCLLPVFAVIAAVGFLFCIDATLTAMLVPAVASYALPLYVINRRVMRMQRRYREISPVARSELGQRVRELLSTGELQSNPNAIASLRRDALRGPTWQGALNALYGRLLADRRVHLLNAAFFIVCLVSILMFFGMRATEQGRSWADFVFYLLALRYAMTALKQTTSLGAKFSRFYSEYHAYATFVSKSQFVHKRRAAATPPQDVPTLAIRLGKAAKWNSPRVLRLTPGSCVLVLTPAAPGFDDLEAALLRIESRIDTTFDLSTHAACCVSVDQLASVDAASCRAAVFTLTAAAKPRAAQWFQKRMGAPAAPVFIVGNDVDSMIAFAGKWSGSLHAIVIEEHQLVGGGDRAWLTANTETIKESLRVQLERTRRRSSNDDALEQDDDEGEE